MEKQILRLRAARFAQDDTAPFGLNGQNFGQDDNLGHLWRER
jgi:hypothetical protein